MPKKKEKGSKIFGSKLDVSRPAIPEQLEQLLTELEKKGGTETEGIFRVSGSQPMIKKLKEAIDEGDKVNFSEFSVHDVSGVTKLYFRELQEPLFTFELYGIFIAAGASGDKDEIAKALALLPIGNRVVLNRLLSFLDKIVHLSNVNKMVPENLATCLVPNLLRQKNETMESTILDYPFLISLFTELIENYEYYFKKEIEDQKRKREAMKERQMNYKKMMEQKYKPKQTEPEPSSLPASPVIEPDESDNNHNDEKKVETPADVSFKNTMNSKYEKIHLTTQTRLSSKQEGTTAMEFQAMLQNQFQRIQSGEVSMQEIRELLDVPAPSRSSPPPYNPPKPPVPARNSPNAIHHNNNNNNIITTPIHNTLPSPSFRYSLDIAKDEPALTIIKNTPPPPKSTVSSNNSNNNNNSATNSPNVSRQQKPGSYINHSNHHLANALEAGRNRSWTTFEGHTEANPSDIRELLKTLPSIPSQHTVSAKLNAVGSSSPKPPPRPPRK